MLRTPVLVAVLYTAICFSVSMAAAQSPSEHTYESLALSPPGDKVASVEIDRSFDSPAAPHGPIVIRSTANGAVLQRLDPCPSCRYSGLTWSRDGAALVFIASDDSSGQATVSKVNQGQDKVQTLVTLKGVANSPRFSPDGRQLALLVTVSATKHTGALEAGAPLTGDIGAASDEQRIATVPAGGGELTFASPDDTFVYEYDWTPDSHGFVGIAAKGDGDANWWVAELDAFEAAGTGLGANSAAGASTGRGANNGPGGGPGARLIAHFPLQMAVPRVSPDGRTVQFIGGLMSDAGVVGGEIYEVPLQGGGAAPRSLTPEYKGSFTSIAWRGSKLFATAIVVDQATINVVDTRQLTVRTLYSALVTTRAGDADTGVEISLAADGKRFATVLEDFAQAPRIVFGTPANPKPLTHDNDSRTAPVKVQSLRWKSDNFEVQGWLVCPTTDQASGTRYPLIVHVHGGPSAAVLPIFGTDYSFYTPVHEWVQKGYCLLLPNPRGSYGQGAQYTSMNVRDFGGGDFRDILAGVDAAVASGPIDPKRVGIHGHSYGGFMTMWAVTHTTRFTAAIAGAGLSNWISYYGTNGIDTWMLPFFGASMYDNPQIYRDVSPLETINAARTPTLLYSGDSDVEVPVTQSFEFWRGLRAKGVTTELHVYPGEGHLLRQPEHVRDLRERLPAWFNRYLKR